MFSMYKLPVAYLLVDSRMFFGKLLVSSELGLCGNTAGELLDAGHCYYSSEEFLLAVSYLEEYTFVRVCVGK